SAVTSAATSPVPEPRRRRGPTARFPVSISPRRNLTADGQAANSQFGGSTQPSLTQVSAHQVHQVLEGSARRLVGGDFHQYAVGDTVADIQIVGISDPARALRRRVCAPQANGVYVGDVILECIDIVYR